MKIVYTTHARQRIKMRRLSLTSIEDTVRAPTRVTKQGAGVYKFVKQQGTKKYHVVASRLERETGWLVISAWIRGEEDPQNWLWWLITLPFRGLWWLVRLLLGWSEK